MQIVIHNIKGLTFRASVWLLAGMLGEQSHYNALTKDWHVTTCFALILQQREIQIYNVDAVL